MNSIAFLLAHQDQSDPQAQSVGSCYKAACFKHTYLGFILYIFALEESEITSFCSPEQNHELLAADPHQTHVCFLAGQTFSVHGPPVLPCCAAHGKESCREVVEARLKS